MADNQFDSNNSERIDMKTIAKYKPELEFSTPELCHIIELFNEQEDSACSIARARVEPGVATQLHSLSGITERYVILEGEGKVEVDGKTATKVGPLDVVYIPAGMSQRINNTGETDLVFLCVCTPRFKPDAYENMET
jgi:mannose-6-phosphate isomerase-like protein (cupin superfamily)